MDIYIVVYTLVLLATLFDLRKDFKVNKSLVLWGLVVCIVLFRGLRWRTGTDWPQFEACFETCTWDNITSYDRYGDGRESMEMGYVFLNWLVKQFGDYTLFLLLTNAFLVGTWAFMAKKLVPQYFLMAFAMILASNMFFPVRLQLAAGIFCWTLYYMAYQKWGYFVVSYIITCLFHKSAIVLLPILPLLLIRVKPIVCYLLIFFSMIGEVVATIFSDYMVLGSIFLSSYYPELASSIEGYSDNIIAGRADKSTSSIVMSFLLSLMLLYGILKGRKKLEMSNRFTSERVNLYLRCFNIYMNCFLLFTFIYKFFSAEILSNLTRMAEYFTCGYAICLIMAYENIISKKNRKIFYVFFMFFFCYKIYGMLYHTPYPEVFFPYYSIFDSVKRVIY